MKCNGLGTVGNSFLFSFFFLKKNLFAIDLFLKRSPVSQYFTRGAPSAVSFVPMV